MTISSDLWLGLMPYFAILKKATYAIAQESGVSL